MKTRVITGIFITFIYAAVILLALYVHPIFFDVFIFLLALCGTYELTNAVKRMFSPPIVVLNLITVVACFGAFWFSQYFFKTYSAGMTGFFLAFALMILVTVLTTAFSKTYVKGNAVSTIFIMLYPCALLLFSLGINAFIDVGQVGVYRRYGLCRRQYGQGQKALSQPQPQKDYIRRGRRSVRGAFRRGHSIAFDIPCRPFLGKHIRLANADRRLDGHCN